MKLLVVETLNMMAVEIAEHRFSRAAPCAEALASAVALALAAGLAERDQVSLVVPGGTTPQRFLEALAHKPLDWSRVTVITGDERWVPVGHPDSNEGMVRAAFRHGPAAAARLVGLWVEGTVEPALALTEVSARLASCPRPWQVAVLGLGADGHVASLFPGQSWGKQPGAAPCLAAIAPDGSARLSLSLCALVEARHLILLFGGATKRAAFDRALGRATSGNDLPLVALLSRRAGPVDVYYFSHE
ncbi:6-phosphogluconolactonase [uncultured Gammaproteobacteria bacterium]